MIGQTIMEIERFLCDKWIRCDQCKGFKEKKVQKEGDSKPRIKTCCSLFKRMNGHYHSTEPYQYCYYFMRKEDLKWVTICKEILKSIGLIIWGILKLPFYPILKIRNQRDYWMKEYYELSRVKTGDDEDY